MFRRAGFRRAAKLLMGFLTDQELMADLGLGCAFAVPFRRLFSHRSRAFRPQRHSIRIPVASGCRSHTCKRRRVCATPSKGDTVISRPPTARSVRSMLYSGDWMSMTLNRSGPDRRLRVFLCHSSEDKPVARDLYRRLLSDGFAPWLDEEELLPGQNWQEAIPAAVRAADVVIICLSQKSVGKEGFLQKEIREALNAAEEKPEGTIFVVPLKLEEVEVPRRLSRWQWADLSHESGYPRLVRALTTRANAIGIAMVSEAEEAAKRADAEANTGQGEEASRRSTTERRHESSGPRVPSRARDREVGTRQVVWEEYKAIFREAAANGGGFVLVTQDNGECSLLAGRLRWVPEEQSAYSSRKLVEDMDEMVRLGFSTTEDGSYFKPTVKGFEWAGVTESPDDFTARECASRETEAAPPTARVIRPLSPSMRVAAGSVNLQDTILRASGWGLFVTNDERRRDLPAHSVSALLEFQHIDGEKRKSEGMWFVPSQNGARWARREEIRMGDDPKILPLFYWIVQQDRQEREIILADRRAMNVNVYGILLSVTQSEPLQYGQWEMLLRLTGDNVGEEWTMTMTLGRRGSLESTQLVRGSRPIT
jgi:TIR domain